MPEDKVPRKIFGHTKVKLTGDLCKLHSEIFIICNFKQGLLERLIQRIHRLFQFYIFKVKDSSENLCVGGEMIYYTDLKEV